MAIPPPRNVCGSCHNPIRSNPRVGGFWGRAAQTGGRIGKFASAAANTAFFGYILYEAFTTPPSPPVPLSFQTK